MIERNVVTKTSVDMNKLLNKVNKNNKLAGIEVNDRFKVNYP